MTSLLTWEFQAASLPVLWAHSLSSALEFSVSGLPGFKHRVHPWRPGFQGFLSRTGVLFRKTFAWDDLDLSDALDDTDKKPTPTPKKPTSGDDFSLEDAVPGGGHDDPMPPGPPKPRPNPNPHHPGTSGGFSDHDLVDQTSGGAGGGGGGAGGGAGGSNQRNDGEEQGQPQGVVPGIIGAVVMAVVGAISSFIAYQKKKLCFKENTDQADINMETNRTTNTEPLVHQTIIEK